MHPEFILQILKIFSLTQGFEINQYGVSTIFLMEVGR